MIATDEIPITAISLQDETEQNRGHHVRSRRLHPFQNR
jgi:hypothetical protein